MPRAALTAGEIAKEAEFFSFGTNDLTQMTFGFSRDDAAKFLGAYYENKIYESDPFQHLDQIGVGKLVKMAAHDGRETRPDLGLGICGEHGGDPTSVEFCHNVGLDYVSCSPFRVPIARLAAAQDAYRGRGGPHRGAGKRPCSRAGNSGGADGARRPLPPHGGAPERECPVEAEQRSIRKSKMAKSGSLLNDRDFRTFDRRKKC